MSSEVQITAKRRGIKTIASRLLDYTNNGVPYDITFYYDEEEPLTETQKARLQAELKKRFELWKNTWIIPAIKEILAKYKKH
jgi:hypothetical protein